MNLWLVIEGWLVAYHLLYPTFVMRTKNCFFFIRKSPLINPLCFSPKCYVSPSKIQMYPSMYRLCTFCIFSLCTCCHPYVEMRCVSINNQIAVGGFHSGKLCTIFAWWTGTVMDTYHTIISVDNCKYASTTVSARTRIVANQPVCSGVAGDSTTIIYNASLPDWRGILAGHIHGVIGW